MDKEDIMHLVLVVLIGLFIIAALIGIVWGCAALYRNYDVWAQGKAGEAEFMKAEQNRRIAVLEATAKRDAAKMLAEAEVERAKGVATANKIVGDSLQTSGENYLRYLWISGMEKSKNQLIYVPTEAGLPILEAGRRR